MTSQDLLEPSIQQLGHELATQAQYHTPGILDHRWWTNLLLDWGTRDEQFKVQLFRFIDVLPALKTDEQFIRILKEYFKDLPSIPLPLRGILKHCSNHSIPARIGTRLLRRQFLKMAYTFMVGESVEQAESTLTHLWKTSSACSIDLLGEATISESEAEQYHQRCLQTLNQLHQIGQSWNAQPLLEEDHLGPLPRIQLSIKLSALSSQFDPIDPDSSYDGVAPRLRSIIDLAQTLPVSITFDMEQAELEPLILSIFMRLFSEPAYRHFPHAGIAVQAYLKHSNHTVDQLLEWGQQRETPFSIRLVKGAYWDSEIVHHQQRNWPVPVYMKKSETDANYETLAKRIIEHRALIRPAFGSHNIRTLAYIQALEEAHQLPRAMCEFQMLYGMAEPLRDTLIKQGYRLRVYTPIGKLLPGMAYLVRRLLENTSNESFIRRQYEATTSFEHLLSSPTDSGTDEIGEQLIDPVHSNHSASQPGFLNEPPTDFSRVEAQQVMTHALEEVTPLLGQTYTYPVATQQTYDGPELTSINPSAPSQHIANFPTLAPEQIPSIIRAAQDRLAYWTAIDPNTRAGFLFQTAQLMREQRLALIAWEILETGKPWREADGDIAEAIDFLEWYGREMQELGRPFKLGRAPGEVNLRTYHARGLAVVIPPWNFPLAIPTGLVSAALVTGNIVLFKPSERSPMMGYHLIRLLQEAGLPEGIVHFLPGGPDIGQALVQHPDIHLIAFTGSQEVGVKILQETRQLAPGQRHIKHVIAEMGGKNAVIVDETADLDEAVTGVLASATGYQGQKCSACSRVILLQDIYDIFIERLTQAALSLPIGPPVEAHNQMGPIIDHQALQRVRQFIEEGKKDGTCLLDRQLPGPGYFQGPVILADLPISHRILQEEIFGPVIAVLKASTIDDAVRLANDSRYALTGGIYSRSPANIRQVQNAVNVGNFYINRPITGSLVGRQPFGGHQLSGVGRKAGGHGYLEQFMVEKITTENTLRRGFAPVQ